MDFASKYLAWRAIRGVHDNDVADCLSSEPPPPHRAATVLCCHGYASNVAAFLARHCKDMRTHQPTADLLELHGVDGPATVNDSSGRQRAWWRFDPEFPMDRTQQPQFWRRAKVGYVGAEAAVELLVDAWRRGAYDGLLGFSQGAAMAAMLCARLEQLRPRSTRRPRFIILVSGFRTPLPRNPALRWYAELGAASLRTRALVISGEHDTATPPAAVGRLAALFTRRVEHIVAGGQHAMPRRPADLAAISEFVARAMRGSGEDGEDGSEDAPPPPPPPLCPSGASEGISPSPSSALLLLPSDAVALICDALRSSSSDALVAAASSCRALRVAFSTALADTAAIFRCVERVCFKVRDG